MCEGSAPCVRAVSPHIWCTGLYIRDGHGHGHGHVEHAGSYTKQPCCRTHTTRMPSRTELGDGLGELEDVLVKRLVVACGVGEKERGE